MFDLSGFAMYVGWNPETGIRIGLDLGGNAFRGDGDGRLVLIE